MSKKDDEYYRNETNEEIHTRRSKEDKVFGNGYKTGDGMLEEDEYRHTSSIKVESEYSDKYLSHIYEYEEGLESTITLNSIFEIVKKDKKITEILESGKTISKSPKVKLKREQVNFLFNRIDVLVNASIEATLFSSSIYILEVISALTSNEYKKLFDMLDTEIQEKLLIELNSKYKFLDSGSNKKRIH